MTVAGVREGNAMESLFMRLGGENAVEAAVEAFYAKVMADDRIRGFFDGIDMTDQKRKQRDFLTMAFGGPNVYDGRDMRSAHAWMNLEDPHFDAVVENLGATLQELGVPAGLIGEAAEIAESVRDEVLNREPTS